MKARTSRYVRPCRPHGRSAWNVLRNDRVCAYYNFVAYNHRSGYHGTREYSRVAADSRRSSFSRGTTQGYILKYPTARAY
jgi:hypothetical protein